MNRVIHLNLRAALVSFLMLASFLAVWHVSTLPSPSAGAPVATALTAEQIEYAKLMGKTAEAPKKSDGFPTPSQMMGTFVSQLSHPFYDNGPNDKGIAIQLAHSLARVGFRSCWPVWSRCPWAS